jgi:uncharacterized protein (DUF697 family)
MYRNKQHCRVPQYESNDEYNFESDLEMENAYNNSEFNYESGNNYEMAPGFEINEEKESDSEYNGNYELNGEFNPRYGEMENGGGYKDEMELELENVTNEEEFSNWVNEIVVRDHRGQGLRSVMNHPVVRRTVNHLSSIASRTLPYLGVRRGGWRGISYRSPSRYNYANRRYNYNYANNYGPGYWRHHNHPHWGSNLSQPPYPDTDTTQQAASTGTDTGPAPQQTDQDGSFKNFVMDTIKNLSQQIAAGNESIAAIKNSVASSAANNFPSIVQSKTDAPAPPPDAPAAGQQPEFEANYEYNMETNGEVSDLESSFSEETEMDLASDLLAVKNEMELDHFLGGLLKKAVGAVSGILGSGPGKLLTDVLKTVAKKALPLAGAAAGTFFGGPLGTAIGGQLGSAASNLFELELEGMSNEDREFEVARAVVRFAGNAARQVADNLTGNSEEDVRNGVTEAATRFAPGLLRRKHHHHHSHHHHHQYNNDYNNNGYENNDSTGSDNGTWHRRGNKIIIENI